MNDIDISLEAILRSGRSRLPGLLGLPGDHVPIPADIRTIWGDKVGFLTLVSRARKHRSLVQIEFQAARDPNMTTRMLSLLSAIRSWATTQPEFEKRWPCQTVVYVGSKPWKSKTEINEFNLRYSHGFVDARDIDPEPLLNSDNLRETWRLPSSVRAAHDRARGTHLIELSRRRSLAELRLSRPWAGWQIFAGSAIVFDQRSQRWESSSPRRYSIHHQM